MKWITGGNARSPLPFHIQKRFLDSYRSMLIIDVLLLISASKSLPVPATQYYVIPKPRPVSMLHHDHLTPYELITARSAGPQSRPLKDMTRTWAQWATRRNPPIIDELLPDLPPPPPAKGLKALLQQLPFVPKPASHPLPPALLPRTYWQYLTGRPASPAPLPANAEVSPMIAYLKFVAKGPQVLVRPVLRTIGNTWKQGVLEAQAIGRVFTGKPQPLA